jgi:hypothetical protein
MFVRNSSDFWTKGGRETSEVHPILSENYPMVIRIFEMDSQRIRCWTLAGPLLAWLLAALASLMPATRRFASSTVSRFVTPNVPPPGADANAVQSECPLRTSCPLASPTGQNTKSRRACADVSFILRRVPCRKDFRFALEC